MRVGALEGAEQHSAPGAIRGRLAPATRARGRASIPARVLALQRTAGNRAVTRLIQRSPKIGLWAAPKPFEGAVSSDPYERQPEALRRVVGEASWDGLDREDRSTVTSLYNRFQKLGLWGYVQRIRKVKKGQPPWCGVWINGDTPSVYFEGDAKGLSKALIFSHKVCLDPWYGAMMHKGQASHREISDSDGLHVSIGPGPGEFDAHIDKHAPVKRRDGHYCSYDPAASVQHHLVEAALSPGSASKYLGIPLRPQAFQTLESSISPRSDLPELFEQDKNLAELSKPTLYYGVGLEGRFSMGLLEGKR